MPGEAKQERVLGNADFLFGGMGIDKKSGRELGLFHLGMGIA
jgi:hypothetical protein